MSSGKHQVVIGGEVKSGIPVKDMPQGSFGVIVDTPSSNDKGKLLYMSLYGAITLEHVGGWSRDFPTNVYVKLVEPGQTITIMVN